MSKKDVLVLLNDNNREPFSLIDTSGKWSNLGQSKKKKKKKKIKNIFKVTNLSTQNFQTFQELIHEINLNTLGCLK